MSLGLLEGIAPARSCGNVTSHDTIINMKSKKRRKVSLPLRTYFRYCIATILYMQLVKRLFIWPLLDAKEPGKCSFVSGNQAS